MSETKIPPLKIKLWIESYDYSYTPKCYHVFLCIELIKARVASYQNEGSATSYFNFRIFYPATELSVEYRVLDDRDESGDLQYTSYDVTNITQIDDTVFQIDLLENYATGANLNVPCTSLEVTNITTNVADNNGNARKFEDDDSFQTFYAWTSKFKISSKTSLRLRLT